MHLCTLYLYLCTNLSILHLHDRKPKLPVDMEFEKPAEDDGNHLNISWDPEEIIQYAEKMGELRKNIYDKAKRNIDATLRLDWSTRQLSTNVD